MVRSSPRPGGCVEDCPALGDVTVQHLMFTIWCRTIVQPLTIIQHQTMLTVRNMMFTVRCRTLIQHLTNVRQPTRVAYGTLLSTFPPFEEWGGGSSPLLKVHDILPGCLEVHP